MKKLINSVSLLLIALALFSCSEGDNTIDTVFNNTVIGGGTLRTIPPITSPTIALGDPNAKFEVTVEVQDAKNGTDTEKIDVYASFKDNFVADGNNTKAEVLIKTIAASEFTAGTRELPFAKVIVTAAELKSKLVLTDTQYTGGDQFVIRLSQVMKDGRVFTNTNANANVLGGAYFSSPFRYNANVVCPITENLAGSHTYVTTNMKAGAGAGVSGASCGGTVTGTVIWTATATAGVFSTTDLGFGQFGSSCWGDNPATSAGARITWFCSNLVASGTDQYGDSYTYKITAASGNKITIEWRNTYGDAGTTVITRQGGANWPTIFAR